jgi:hypothetical protein
MFSTDSPLIAYPRPYISDRAILTSLIKCAFEALVAVVRILASCVVPNCGMCVLGIKQIGHGQRPRHSIVASKTLQTISASP